MIRSLALLCSLMLVGFVTADPPRLMKPFDSADVPSLLKPIPKDEVVNVSKVLKHKGLVTRFHQGAYLWDATDKVYRDPYTLLELPSDTQTKFGYTLPDLTLPKLLPPKGVTLPTIGEILRSPRIAAYFDPEKIAAPKDKVELRTDVGKLLAKKSRGEDSPPKTWNWSLETADYTWGIAPDDKRGKDPEVFDRLAKLVNREVIVTSRAGYLGIGNQKVLLTLEVKAAK